MLLRSKDVPRNDWPLARISKIMISDDGKVRKVEVMTCKNQGWMKEDFSEIEIFVFLLVLKEDFRY